MRDDKGKLVEVFTLLLKHVLNFRDRVLGRRVKDIFFYHEAEERNRLSIHSCFHLVENFSFLLSATRVTQSRTVNQNDVRIVDARVFRDS